MSSGNNNNNNNNNRDRDGSAEKSSTPLEEWMDALGKMTLKRNEINLLIMDYLISEGFKEAAERFKSEANIDSNKVTDIKTYNETDDQIDQRIAVRSEIENGNIEQAIRLINDFYPELIDNNRHIHFKLQQQQLIELIRNHNIMEALNFAQKQLGVDGSCIQLEELERTLSLLAFEHPEKSPYSDLLHTAHRQHLASRINEAILKDQFGDDETPTPKLVTLLKLLLWTQSELETKKVKHTKLVDLPQGTFASSGSD
ncbi:PREDICTED: glucose-induced degradation protein 8 homolog [Rhagoletis zephyria]|uniref:glucose-induced degradation protein 8 homolog n=1 Tax=Rhagoletis zephyria TaxID=28612 RepID=UPI0008114428|nr:PREDICTED: glucose-induced degradation protein 8 homolog [Rhagoletis zephyria]